MADPAEVPLIMPTGVHGLRSTLDAAFARAKVAPRVIQEVDSLAMLMDAVHEARRHAPALGGGETIPGRRAHASTSPRSTTPAWAGATCWQPVGRRTVARRTWHRGWCWPTPRADW